MYNIINWVYLLINFIKQLCEALALRVKNNEWMLRIVTQQYKSVEIFTFYEIHRVEWLCFWFSAAEINWPKTLLPFPYFTSLKHKWLHLFSYELIGDGNEHTVELLAAKKNFTLRVDGGIARSVVNDGQRSSLQTEGDPLYIGGVPVSVGKHAQGLWHLRNSSSIRGKYSNLIQIELMWYYLQMRPETTCKSPQNTAIMFMY